MEIKKILKNTSYLISSKIVAFFVGIVSSKISALLIGTEGVGIVSQVQNVQGQLSNLALMGMNDGLVKLIAQNKDDEATSNKVASLIKTYIVLISIVFTIVFILIIVFSKQLTIFVLGNLKYFNYFLFVLLSLPLLVLNSISFALLKAFKEIRYIAHSQIIAVLLGLLFFIPLIYYFRIWGAVAFCTLSVFTTLILNEYYAKKRVLNVIDINFKDIFKSKFNYSVVKELLTFAGAGITNGLTVIISELAIRAIIVNELGIDNIGIYSPVIAGGAVFTGFILPSIYTYLFPRFSELKSQEAISEITNDAIRLMTFMLFPLLILVVPYRSIIIPAFYSHQFIKAEIYLPWHFIGIAFTVWMAIYSQVFAPTGRIKSYVVLSIIMQVINFFIVYTFVPLIGLTGWMLKFLIPPVIFFFVYFFYLKKGLKLKIDIKNIFLMSFLIAVTLFEAIFLKNNLYGYILPWIFLSLSYFFITAQERKFILSKVFQILKNIKNN